MVGSKHSEDPLSISEEILGCPDDDRLSAVGDTTGSIELRSRRVDSTVRLQPGKS